MRAERPAPPRERGDRPPPPEGKRGGKPQRYSLEQALSGKAQLHTIAFSGLAFLSGDFAADTFLPPGKVSDYFGFQYLRDIDAAQGGHSTSRVTLNAISRPRKPEKGVSEAQESSGGPSTKQIINVLEIF